MHGYTIKHYKVKDNDLLKQLRREIYNMLLLLTVIATLPSLVVIDLCSLFQQAKVWYPATANLSVYKRTKARSLKSLVGSPMLIVARPL